MGTASWRFLGWCGILYDEDKYLWGRNFSKKRFDERCLEEYAAFFPTVEVDSTYYSLPKIRILEGLASLVPPDFLFSFKVPDLFTIKNYPPVASFGSRAGKANEYFLSESVFQMGFLRHLEKIRSRVGALIFEFSHFDQHDFEHGRDFVERLAAFFSRIPTDWRYAVEVRNRNLLHPDHFAMLQQHGVAHVYNQWTLMPPVLEQLDMHPLESNPFIVARFLLSPGRSFASAKKKFEPFNRLQEIDPGAREAMVKIARHTKETPDRPGPAFLYVGNDLEGNALHTIADVLEWMEHPPE